MKKLMIWKINWICVKEKKKEFNQAQMIKMTLFSKLFFFKQLIFKIKVKKWN